MIYSFPNKCYSMLGLLQTYGWLPAPPGLNMELYLSRSQVAQQLELDPEAHTQP